jgi:hypothetical protein
MTLKAICQIMKAKNASGCMGNVKASSGKMPACTTASSGANEYAAQGLGLVLW